MKPLNKISCIFEAFSEYMNFIQATNIGFFMIEVTYEKLLYPAQWQLSPLLRSYFIQARIFFFQIWTIAHTTYLVGLRSEYRRNLFSCEETFFSELRVAEKTLERAKAGHKIREQTMTKNNPLRRSFYDIASYRKDFFRYGWNTRFWRFWLLQVRGRPDTLRNFLIS